MTDYRPGDIVSVEMELQDWLSEPCLHRGPFAPMEFAKLVKAGKVTLVRRAEPDWQPGDIGQHIETGELYYHRGPGQLFGGGLRHWLWLNAPEAVDPWYSRDDLAGKLVRCTVTPEVAS